MKISSLLKSGSVFLCIPLLFAGCSGGDRDTDFKTAFHQAVDLFYEEAEEPKRRSALKQMRQALLDGGNPNLAYEEVTPLYLAIWEHDTELVTLLLDRGADLHTQDMDQDGDVDNLPLEIAILDPGAKGINLDIIKSLIAAGSDVNGNDSGLPPLGLAAEANSMDTVKVLLQAGADPNGRKDREDYRPLLMATMNGNVEMFDLLRASGAELQDVGLLLKVAAGSTKPEMVKRVLPLYSGPKKIPEIFEIAAWGLLVEDGDEAQTARARIILEQLRAAGFEPVPNEFDKPMVNAAESLDKPALETMLSYGASANATGEAYGATCLMQAIKAASWRAMMGTDIDAKGLFKYQDTRVKDVVRLLLDHAADVNVRDHNGRTALMYAAESFNVTAVRRLLEQGADRSMVDEHGENAEQKMTKEASFGLPDAFKSLAKKRADQIRLAMESDYPEKSASPPPRK